MKEEKKYSAEKITAIAIENLETQIDNLKAKVKSLEKQLTDRQIIASGSALELAESRGEWETELYYTFVELMETGKKYKLLLEEE